MNALRANYEIVPLVILHKLFIEVSILDDYRIEYLKIYILFGN